MADDVSNKEIEGNTEKEQNVDNDEQTEDKNETKQSDQDEPHPSQQPEVQQSTTVEEGEQTPAATVEVEMQQETTEDKTEEPANTEPVTSEGPAAVTSTGEGPAGVTSEGSAAVTSEEPIAVTDEEPIAVTDEEPIAVTSEEPVAITSEVPTEPLTNGLQQPDNVAVPPAAIEEQQPLTTGSSDNLQQTTTSGEETAKKDDEQKSNSLKPSGSSSAERKSTSRRRDKKKKKKQSMPKLQRRSSSKIGTVAEEYIQGILYPYMVSQDQLATGLLHLDVVLQVLYHPQLNLQLTEEDLPYLQSVIDYDQQGLVDYAALSANAHRIITYIYSQQPDSQEMWVELQGIDGTKVTYNKKTGEIIDHAEDGMDLFESTIKDMFKAADSDGKGFITKETFLEMLQDKAAELSYDQINELVDKLPDGNITYAQFHGVGKESVLKIYQAKDQTDSEWMFLNSPSVGGFYLNKVTGETKRDIGVSNMQEAAFFENAYSQINDLTLELEQERAKNRELDNQIAQMNEHLEETVAQLDETGRHLDNTNLELSAREEEIEQLRTLITEKDKSIAKLSTKSDEVTSLEGKLDKTSQELTEARQVITDKDGRIKDLEKTIQDLSVTVDAITDELKNAHGVIDARDSNITSLQYNLTNEQGRVKELKHKMPSLEIRLTSIVDDLTTTKRLLEERTTQLRQTKKQLKQLKKLTSENDKKMETLEQAKEKLVVTENENRTLKSFLTSKTAMIERRKKELQELKDKMSEMETRDNRRALILADVLEKTARSYQQQLKVTDPISISDNRPISAPSIPLEDLIEYQQDRLSESFSLPAAKLTPAHKTLQKSPPKKTSPTKNKIKSRVVTKLPPIKPQQRDFSFTTNMEMRRNYKKTDNAIATSKRVMEKGECDCEICSLNKEQTDKEMPPYLSSMAHSNNGLEQIKNEVDRRERDLAKQLKVGQRVLVQIKKSKFDLEPQKLTGIVKYIGNVDSEFIDDRIYVGVKLDEPVGNTDGIYKGKKYFDCPANHGRMLRVTSVLAVMPNKGIIYRPLQLSGQSNNTTHTSIRTMS